MTSRPLQRFLLAILVSSMILMLCSASDHPDYLSPDSVVLITGAAGFLGSELAMALHRTYNVKKIICVDSMATSTLKEEELAMFEFQRQRAFHVMQSLQKKVHFYRADFRPSIPEYFDMGEVPILEYIWRDHPDITHVVHLAEPFNANQAVPRIKEDIKAGMMEALLEQIYKSHPRPHFTYASSYEVYNHLSAKGPFQEDKPITTPSTLKGASKVMDELMARTYYEMDNIYSIGLRFFPVYGPWGVPGSPLFEMAERAVTDDEPILNLGESSLWDDVRDYVYIEDAIDAVLMAMQVRTPDNTPLVVNVGSGQGTSLREIARQMQELLPRATRNASPDTTNANTPTISYASTERARQILGFQARISLQEGLTKLLAWHYDRAYPYGGGRSQDSIASQGIAGCSPFDSECLSGTPVFPCASECSHEAQCTSSFFDDVLIFTRSVTASCTEVMYTVALQNDLEAIPSANIAISTEHAAHLEENCNIAFVSETSLLVKKLKKERGLSSFFSVVEEFMSASRSNGKNKILNHGIWTLVPVAVPSFSTGDEHILNLLPKLSPGLFFAKTTKHAIYCDPDVVFKSIPALLAEAKMQPFLEGAEGATAMLVARERPANAMNAKKPRSIVPLSESVQNAAYRMIRIGVIDEMTSGYGFQPLLDSSWVVHTLQNEDSRLFRCDVFGEVVQWNVSTDQMAFEFIVGLHDMWSRVIAKSSGNDPWWIGDSVLTVSQTDALSSTTRNRRRKLGDVGGIAEAVVTRKLEGDVEVLDVNVDLQGTEHETGHDQQGATVEDQEGQEPKVSVESDGETREGENEADSGAVAVDAGFVAEDVADLDAESLLKMAENGAGDDTELQSGNDEETDGGEKNAAFAAVIGIEHQPLEGEGQEEQDGFLGPNNPVDTVDPLKVSTEEDEDENENIGTEEEHKEIENQQDDPQNEVDTGDDKEESNVFEPLPLRDLSAYDTWMGVLSSTSVHYFVRIVPASEVGASYLDNYKY